MGSSSFLANELETIQIFNACLLQKIAKLHSQLFAKRSPNASAKSQSKTKHGSK